MKTRVLGYVGGLMVLGVAAFTLSTYSVDTSEAMADADTQIITVNCAAGSLTTFAPSLDIVITRPAVASTAAAAFTDSTAAATFAASDAGSGTPNTTGVNGDSAPSVTVAAGSATGYIKLSYGVPKMKLAGLACQSGGYGKTELAAAHVATAGSAMATRLSTDLVWANAEDTLVSKELYGDLSVLNTAKAALEDNATAAGDGAIDGEIVFGGVINALHDVNMTTIAQVNQVHTMTYTFTPATL